LATSPGEWNPPVPRQEATPKVRAWAQRVVTRPSVQASVVPDFTERFVTTLRQNGAWVAGRFA